MNVINKSDLFHTGEYLAAKYMEGKGYEILCKNFRKKGGEIDIIARGQHTLIFIEVKTRSFHSMNSALQNISVTKQRRITSTADKYITQNPELGKLRVRFDVIVIFHDNTTNTYEIKHLEDAFLPVF